MNKIQSRKFFILASTFLIITILPWTIQLAQKSQLIISSADYKKSCQLQMPPIGSICRSGRIFEGECQIVHCPKGCGGNKSCGLKDPGAYRTIEKCSTAKLEPDECGQIDTVSSAKGRKYCRVDGYCDYKVIKCMDSCKGPEKPKNGNGGSNPSATPPLYISSTPYAIMPVCSCDNMTFEGDLGAGGTVDVIFYGRVNKPEIYDDMQMTFYVEKDGALLARSVPQLAKALTDSPNIFSATWRYNLPKKEQAIGDYRIYGKINCSEKTAYDLRYQDTSVLGTEKTRNKLSFASLIDYFRRIFGLKPIPKPTYPQAQFDLTGTVTVLRPTGVSSLQLGTFLPKAINIQKGCDQITFTIPETEN